MKTMADIPHDQLVKGWIVRTRDGEPPAQVRGNDTAGVLAFVADKRDGDKFFFVPAPPPLGSLMPLPSFTRTIDDTFDRFRMTGMSDVPAIRNYGTRIVDDVKALEIDDVESIQAERFTMLELDEEP